MGHSWREMDPQGAAEHDAEIDLFLLAQKNARGRSLADFTAEDIPALMGLFCPATSRQPSAEELRRIASISNGVTKKRKP